MLPPPLSFALAAHLVVATAALGQQLAISSAWAPDLRLAPVTTALDSHVPPAPPQALRLAGSRTRHAIVSVLAGAMFGTAIGLLESTNVRKGCAVPPPGSICSVRESSDRPIVIGAALGATVGFLYHLSRVRTSSGHW